MKERKCYNCRFLRLKGALYSGHEYFTCLLYKDYRDAYGFDSRACPEWKKARVPRKEKKKHTPRRLHQRERRTVKPVELYENMIF